MPLVAITCFGPGTAGARSIAARQALQATHVPEVVRDGSATALGALDNTQHLTLYLALPMRNQADLQRLLHDLYERNSPMYHRFLSYTEFTQRYGPRAQDYDTVVAWAEASGFVVTGTVASRHFVRVEAPVEAINRVFQVEMTNYRHPTKARTFYAPDREPTTSGLAVPLLEIGNMSDFFIHRAKQGTSSAGIAPAAGSGLDGNYVPGDARLAYYGNGPLTGAGQRVGVIEFEGYRDADWQSYLSQTGTSTTVPVTKVLVPSTFTDPCTEASTCKDGEAVIDILFTIGVAPGLLELRVYETGNGESELPVLDKIASDGDSKIILICWSFSGNQLSDDSEIQRLAAQGVSIVHASGDDGAFDDTNANWFDVDPLVTQVGGTELTTSNGAWNEEIALPGSGGGYLSTAIPNYQQFSGVINPYNGGSTQYRNSPDVALVAYDMLGWSDQDELQPYSFGTSFAAPEFAGFLALVNQQSLANGQGAIGAVNLELYSIGVSEPLAYHDITSGSNGTFSAVSGYDLVTGWGSPAGTLLIDQLAGLPGGIAAPPGG
jgi:xanthomonalisin